MGEPVAMITELGGDFFGARFCRLYLTLHNQIKNQTF